MEPSRPGKLALVTLVIGLVVAGLALVGSFEFQRAGYKSGQAPGTGEATLPSRDQLRFPGPLAGQPGLSATSETNQIAARSGAQVEHPAGAVRNRTEAIKLAREAARTDGRDLANYQEPRASFHNDARWNYWFVFFDGKSGAFVDHFAVRLDDLTGATRLISGR
jgi:hypothetical protein